jgi:hypothetical protein
VVAAGGRALVAEQPTGHEAPDRAVTGGRERTASDLDVYRYGTE